MGTYTQLVVTAILHKVPELDLNLLKWMFGSREGGMPTALPDHPFFKCERWHWICNFIDDFVQLGACRDFAESEREDDEPPKYHISGICSLKDYDNEIEKFFDWINQFAYVPGRAIGWARTEENEQLHPTIYYAPGVWDGDVVVDAECAKL